MKKVLVIEDNRDNLRLITFALERAGYRVGSASSGEEGVALAVRERPYFIVMDINLPGIDGFEACHRLRVDEVRTPILMLTARDAVDDRVTGLDGDNWLTRGSSSTPDGSAHPDKQVTVINARLAAAGV